MSLVVYLCSKLNEMKHTNTLQEFTLEQFFKEEEKQVVTYSDYFDVTKVIDKVISEIDVRSYRIDDEFYLFVNKVIYEIGFDLLTMLHNLPNTPLRHDMKHDERELKRIERVVEKKLIDKKVKEQENIDLLLELLEIEI